MNKTLVVFIHGLGANKNTWNNLLKTFKADFGEHFSARKFKDLKPSDTLFYDFFEYKSSIYGDFFNFNRWKKNNFKGVKANNEINIIGISDALKTYFDVAKEDFEKIFIIAHSMGGIIALDCIVRHKVQFNKLALLASPIAGSDNADQIKKYFDEKFYFKGDLFSAIVQELATDSNTMTNLRDNISKHQYYLQMHPILFINPNLDARISDDSMEMAKMFCSKVETVNGTHNSIKEPKNKTDLIYHLLKSFLNHEEKQVSSIKKLRTHWESFASDRKEKYPFIVTKSRQITTIYTNKCVIDNFRYDCEMMQKGKIKFQHCFKPFDEIVEEKVEDDDFFKNGESKRFSQKSYKVRFVPRLVHIDVTKTSDNGWFCLQFESEMLDKGAQVSIEVSISDIVDFSDKKSERFKRYFDYTVEESTMPHAIRERVYQIESYEDKENDTKLPFEPILSVDGVEQLNSQNCSQNIYYRTWEWKFFYEDGENRTMNIELRRRNNILSCVDI